MSPQTQFQTCYTLTDAARWRHVIMNPLFYFFFILMLLCLITEGGKTVSSSTKKCSETSEAALLIPQARLRLKGLQSLHQAWNRLSPRRPNSESGTDLKDETERGEHEKWRAPVYFYLLCWPSARCRSTFRIPSTIQWEQGEILGWKKAVLWCVKTW